MSIIVSALADGKSSIIVCKHYVKLHCSYVCCNVLLLMSVTCSLLSLTLLAKLQRIVVNSMSALTAAMMMMRMLGTASSRLNPGSGAPKQVS